MQRGRRQLGSALALLGVLALAGATVWAWTRAQTAAARPPEPELDPVRVEPPTAEPALARDVAVPPAVAAEDELQRSPPAPDEPLDCRVEVVFDADGLPAAGADVYWFRAAAGASWLADLGDLGLSREFLQRHGRHFVAGERGLADVPSDALRVQVVAATASHFGIATRERRGAPGEPLQVRLRPAHGVDVIVRSARSKEPAAGVLVAATCSLYPESKVGAHTDASGRAKLWPLFREEEPRAPWYAEITGLFHEEQRVPLAPGATAAPIEFVLPESARAVVRIVDVEGKPIDSGGTLTVAWRVREPAGTESEQLAREATGSRPSESGLPRAFEEQVLEVPILGGVARLGRVEAGCALRMHARLQKAERGPTREFTIDGPSRDTVRLDLEAPRP